MAVKNMKKICLLLFLLLAALALALGGCGEEQKAQNKTNTVQLQAKEQRFIVYRAAADGSEYLLPEQFIVPDNGRTPMENALQNLVGTKPKDAKFDDVVPIGTKVLGLRVENGVAYADFSRELASRRQGSYEEMMLVYAIVNTLTEFPEVQRVQILVEGKKVVSLSGHMDVEAPLERNLTLLRDAQAKKL